MGLRYRQTYTEDGDILDGLGWVLDNAELAGEMNGSLDRDNLPAETIARAEIEDAAFTEVLYLSTTNPYGPSMSSVEWQGGGNGLFYLSFDASEDCVATVEMYLTWLWGDISTYSYDIATLAADTLQVRFTLDGQVLALSERHDDARYNDHMSLVGIAVLNAGTHVLQADCRVARVICNTEEQDWVNEDSVTIGARGLLITEEKR